MKYFVRFIAVSAASILSVHAQTALQASRSSEGPQSVWKPDFTISNANANGSGAIVCSANGLLLAVGSENSVKIYQLNGGNPSSAKLTRTLSSVSPIRAMTFCDSNILISLSADRSIKTWDTGSGRTLHHISLNSDNFTVFAFPPGDLPFLATGSRNRVMLWNYKTGKLLSTSETTDSSVAALAFTPDGKLLIIGTHKGVVRVLDVATRKITRTIDLDSPICALSASKKFIMLGYSDGTLAQLSFASQTSTHEVSGQNDAVTVIAFSPNGERFASGNADGTVKIWDTESLKPLASLKGNAAAIFSIVFSADSHTLVSSTTNGVINGWRLPINP